MNYHQAQIHEYPQLVDIWARSVKQTHDFLQVEDFKKIEKELPTYFPHLDVKIWTDLEKVIGFSGVDGNKLEMFFLDPKYIGKGYGKRIVRCLLEESKIQFVDVNEQNLGAKNFYQVMGFEEYDRSEVDDAGRSYPIIHLKTNSDSLKNLE
ncbi:GNAT family N-acetyltransferase [Enterococcus caccae]|uniref:N-acetyltransferase domain-containing protein n=1 Tax=Enterococcus caccae ATCC BAA-1240 TaxID=1158612 RepID=R3WNL3_9ENTE|nr:GNAT family N-acetyltransferase [Enterococcus caccae]EOL48997.1 hypothetical protein UC7_00842 [Enterococcus caccae ATCC BAA-1240]EOT65390.1 hypothetical protein I580_01146 [Enterococcus caccae ATCC BAA-1240]OJG25032.1 hypothetical protein RU98_GL001133 [Enterococcus caccae]